MEDIWWMIGGDAPTEAVCKQTTKALNNGYRLTEVDMI